MEYIKLYPRGNWKWMIDRNVTLALLTFLHIELSTVIHVSCPLFHFFQCGTLHHAR